MTESVGGTEKTATSNGNKPNATASPIVAGSVNVASELILFLQWYETSRQKGMGMRQSMERAVSILTLDDEAVDALLDGRICEGKEAEYVDVICKGSKGTQPAFKVGDMYYCSCCGSPTRRKFVT